VFVGIVAVSVGLYAMVLQGLLLAVAAGWFLLGSMPRAESAVAFLAERESDETLHLLVVGNDTRQAIPSDDPYWFGRFTGERADVVLLVAIEPSSTGLRVLSLDRNLRVETEEFGPLTIGETFGYGGSPLLVQSVTQLTRLPIHRYMEIRFDGFVRLIDALGGVTIPFCAQSRDLVTGLQAPPGRRDLNGEEALSLIRSRAFERKVDGEWVAVDQGNSGRMGRQRFLIEQVLVGLNEGFGLKEMLALGAAARDLAVLDEGWGIETSLAVFEAARGGSVAWEVLPTAPVRSQAERTSPFAPSHIGGRLYLELAPEAAETLRTFSRFEGSQGATGGPGVPLAPTGISETPTDCV
jgi:LCP family protein required for cell wall assembly